VSPAAGVTLATGPEAATAAAVCFELQEARKRLARARADESAELHRLAALSQIAAGAGVPVDEIAGVPSERGSRRATPDVEARIACALGAGEPRSEQALVGALAPAARGADEVSAALRRLVDAGDACVAPAARYRLTAQGAARLPARLRQATMPPAREWIVRVASTPVEAAAAERRAGTHDPVVARAGTRAPELAWRVEASEPETAVETAIARTHELRAAVDGAAAGDPVVVVALVHPHHGTP
jgi:hypothetical protein